MLGSKENSTVSSKQTKLKLRDVIKQNAAKKKGGIHSSFCFQKPTPNLQPIPRHQVLSKNSFFLFFPITITTEGRSHAGSSVVQETFPPFDNKVNIQRHQGFMQAEASKKQEGKATFPRLCNKAQNNIWVSWVLVESTSRWVSNGLSLQTQVWLIILLFLQSKMLCLFYCLFWVL